MKKVVITISCIAALLSSSCTNTKKEEVKDQTVESVTGKKEFSEILTWGNTSFEISTMDNVLTIQPKGLEIVNDEFTHDILGKTIVGTDIEDLNADGYAEVLIYLTSDGSGSYGEVIAYSVNDGKSMSEITYNVEGDSDEIKKGYMGHDKYSIVDKVFTREFPIYKESDTNANPTGGSRIIQHKLINGSNSRKFIVDKVLTKE